MKLSIIVPVYNSAKYLHKCIDSILCQTMTDFECILINDGSKDNSLQICQEYESKDKRIIVKNITNHGSAYARNIGLTLAKGKYIGFVDSDDWIDNDMYEKLVSKAEEYNADIVSCDMEIFFNKQKRYYNTTSCREGLYNKNNLINEIYPNLICSKSLEYNMPFTMVLKIFKHSLIIENKIQFKNDFRLAQDYVFSVTTLYHANSFYYLKKLYCYHYFQNQNSRTHKYLPNALELMNNINTYFYTLTKDCLFFDFSSQIQLQKLYGILTSINYLAKPGKGCSKIYTIKQIRKILINNIERDTLNIIEWKKLSLAKWIILKLIKFKLYTICSIIITCKY